MECFPLIVLVLTLIRLGISVEAPEKLEENEASFDFSNNAASKYLNTGMTAKNFLEVCATDGPR